MILQLKNITKQFGGISALREVNFTMNEGEVLGLIGPNGAGKTTLFNIITSMYSPTRGEVWFQDEKIQNLKPSQVTKKGIGRTFQNIRLFDQMTVQENIIVGNHCRLKSGVWSSVFRSKAQQLEEERARQNAAKLLELVGLSAYEDAIASSLSYGQQRRLEIARALASQPKLILLDEPAAGMNDKETAELYHLIKEIQQRGIGVLLIEHDMALVMKVCDRIVVLNFGEKIAEDVPNEIQNHPEVIEAYLGKEEAEKHA